MPLASRVHRTSPAVHLDLVQAAKGYNPGDTVHALLHIRDAERSGLAGRVGRPPSPSPPPRSSQDDGGLAKEGSVDVGTQSIQLEDVLITFKGIERVDTSWVSKSYRREVKPLNADTRRVQRPVIEATLQASTGRDLGDDGCRVYLIRFRLPEWLPPTFHGLAVRYSYYLDVRVRWSLVSLNEEGADAGGGQVVGSHLLESRIRDVVHVWPLETRRSQAGTMDEVRFKEQERDGSLPRVKCWEVGFGTTIDDAIENLELLWRDSSTSGPYSPVYLSNSLSRTSSSEPEPGRRPGGVGRSMSEEPSALLSRKLFRAAQKEILAEQLSANLRIVAEESASVVQGGSKSAPKTPIAGTANALARYWDGMPGSKSSFRLRVGDAEFATIHLHQASAFVEEGKACGLAPGASLVSTLEFINTDVVRCLKYVVSLEMEETVAEAWRWKGRGHVLSSIVEERASLSPDTLASCVYFTLPSDATPGFESDVVTLAWGLRFEFCFVSAGGRAEKVEWKIPIRFGCTM